MGNSVGAIFPGTQMFTKIVNLEVDFVFGSNPSIARPDPVILPFP